MDDVVNTAQVLLWVLAAAALVTMAVVIGVQVARALALRRHARRMVAFAHHRGWRYTPADPALLGRYPGPPSGLGVDRRTAHVLTGHHRGGPFVVFEYSHKNTRRQSAASATRFTVAVVPLPALRPVLEVTHDGRTCHVRTDDERFACDVLGPPTMAWLLAQPRTYPFRFGGDHLIAWCDGAIEPELAVRLLDYVHDVRDRVPAFVWRS